MSYIAADGREITEEMIERWCASYERGEFPEGEHSVGSVVMGRPPLSNQKTESMTIKLPAGMRAALKLRAEQIGVNTSEYVRSVLTDALVSS